MDPTYGFQPSETRVLSGWPSPPAFFLWHYCLAKKCWFTYICVYTFLRIYFLRIWGLPSFQNWLCATWRFICLYSTWSKGGLYALCLFSTSLHFILFCLTNAELPVPIWYKIVWNRSAQTDSNQATVDARIGRASLLFSIPPDLFGLGRNGIYSPQKRATLMFVLMFELAFSGPAYQLCPAELILHPWRELGQQDDFYTTPV